MFENAGKKLKTLAKVLFWIGSILGTLGVVVASIVTASETEDVAVAVVLVILYFLLFTPLIWVSQWIVCLFISAIGELVENSAEIADYTYALSKPFRTQTVKPTPRTPQHSISKEDTPRFGDAFGDKPMSHMNHNNEE